MSKKDFYEILGVSKSASPEEIKKAYRKKAIEFHPDKNPGDKQAEENFKTAAEAYEILGDADKKAKYDQYGHAAFDGAGGYGGGHHMNMDDIFSQFGDIESKPLSRIKKIFLAVLLAVAVLAVSEEIQEEHAE